jgi:DHA1 family inner membrane transport protein
MTIALLSLFLAAFSIGTTEFVVAGLLPEVSADLGVSVPTAGLLMSGYAIGVAVGGPIVSLLTSRLPRKPTIIALMGIFVIGHVLCAIAPTYPLLMAARIVVSMSHGCFFGLAAIIAMSLVPPARTSSALALVFAGISVSNIVGVPLGTAIGHAFGWRTSFWVIGAVAIFAAIAMAYALPRGAAAQKAGARLSDQFRVLRRPKVYMTYIIIVVMMIGFFSLFTFIAPFLTDVSGVGSDYVPGLLLLFGAGATIGIFAGGRLGDWRPSLTLLVAFPAQAAVYAGMVLLGANAAAMAVLLFLMGATGMVTNASMQNRVLKGAAEAPDLASTLISSVFNIGIAIGALVGAAVLANGAGYARLPWIGIATAIATALLVVLALRIDRRREGAPEAVAAR